MRRPRLWTVRRTAASTLLLLLVLASTAAAPTITGPKTGRITGHVRDQSRRSAGECPGVRRRDRTECADRPEADRIPSPEVPEGPVQLRVAIVGYRSVQTQRVGACRPNHSSRLRARGKPAADVGTDGHDDADAAASPAPTSKRRVEEQGKVENRAGGVADAQGALSALPVEPWRRQAEPGNTEAYARIEDNRFLTASANPLSTFSIDVDAASYSNVRRFLSQGTLPPADAVRLEELVNYFSYTYPDHTGSHPFAVSTDVGSCPWDRDHRLVRIGLQAKHVATRDLPPSNLVFLIDVSGSMQSEDKLPLVKQAFRALVQELRPEDRVAIVVYAGAAGLVLPSTSGADKATILEAIDRLEAGGSTAGGAGLRLAYDVARENYLPEGNNRLILATDGDFNVGLSSDAEMIRLVETRREEGTFLTVLGFGTGNLKDTKMEQMADKGNGHYAYIDNFREAHKVFVREFGGTLFTVAKDVKIQVEFNPARVQAYRLLGYENRVLAKEDFADDKKDAGEIGAGHAVTALYEVVPVGAPPVAVAGDSLTYQQVTLKPTASRSNDLLTVRLRYKDPTGHEEPAAVHSGEWIRASGAPPDLRFASAVAAFAMVLRNSEYRGSADYNLVLALARESRGEDEEGYREEFISMVERARTLSAGGETVSR